MLFLHYLYQIVYAIYHYICHINILPTKSSRLIIVVIHCKGETAHVDFRIIGHFRMRCAIEPSKHLITPSGRLIRDMIVVLLLRWRRNPSQQA